MRPIIIGLIGVLIVDGVCAKHHNNKPSQKTQQCIAACVGESCQGQNNNSFICRGLQESCAGQCMQ